MRRKIHYLARRHRALCAICFQRAIGPISTTILIESSSMSVWGKIGGAAAGMLVAGPVGAAVGVIAGHFLIDRDESSGDGDPGVAFTIAVIALSAKMAMADGVVSEEEIEAFDRIFSRAAGRARQCAAHLRFRAPGMAGYETYAGQIARMFRRQARRP